jgi:hypothetical protein
MHCSEFSAQVPNRNAGMVARRIISPAALSGTNEKIARTKRMNGFIVRSTVNEYNINAKD